MTEESEGFSSAGLAEQRLSDLLELLSEQGFTQTQIAARAGLPPQYLSDIKHGRRPMTELVARRLGDGFDVNYEWLLGIRPSMERPQSPSGGAAAGGALWLPLFPHPIEGEPRVHPKWDGSGIEVAGLAVAKLVLCKHPYVLRFRHDDVQGRLRRGDLILVSQSVNEDAEIQVVRHRKKSTLARAAKNGTWSRVANGEILPSGSLVTGHCIGIVWSSLL